MAVKFWLIIELARISDVRENEYAGVLADIGTVGIEWAMELADINAITMIVSLWY